MKLGVLFKGFLLVLFLVACQSGAGIDPSVGVSPAPIEAPNGRVPAKAPPSAQYRLLPPAKVPVPAESGPTLILQDIQQQAETHLRHQRWASSIALAEQGLRIDRRQPAFYLILSESYLALGDITQAQRFADQASRLCATACTQVDRLQRRLATKN